MSAHTPGPWAVDPTVCSDEVMTAHGYAIHEHPIYSSITDAKEIQANARLIAAAPDLLEALGQTLNAMIHLELSDSSKIEWEAAKAVAYAAIAKATGGVA